MSLVRSLDAHHVDYLLIGGYGIPIRTVSLRGVLLTKQTVREKDVQDRLILERAIQYFDDGEKVAS